MESHLRSVIGWARGSKIGGDSSDHSMAALDSLSQDTTVEVVGPSEGEQIPSLEPSPNSQEHGRNEAISARNRPQTQLNSGPVSASDGTDSLLQPDLTHPASETTTPALGDLRGNIKNDLLSGKLEIPPFNNTVSAENQITYQFPPALLDLDYVSKCKKRFDRSELLPDRNLPLPLKIMGYAQSWAMWIAEFPDEETRERLLDRVFEMATKAWFEALRIGYTPDVLATQSAARRTPKKRPVTRGEELPPRLRGWTKPKRDLSPSRMPFLIASHKSGPAWAVTAGELEEAGLSETRIRRRAADHESLAEDGEDLLDRIVDLYDGQIRVSEWFETVPTTKLNPMGRDLQVYCLFEVLKSRTSIHLLQGYYAKHTTTKQKEATQRRIDEEQERQDLFMALALEVEEDDPRLATPPPNSTSPSMEEGPFTSASVMTRPETIPFCQLESLVDAAERIIMETDIPYMVSTFELYEISEDDIATGPPIEALSNNSDRCKHVMAEMLLCARQLVPSSKSAKSSMDVDTNVDTADLQIQIDQKKEILKVLLPSLIAERDAAGNIVDGLDTDTDLPGESTNASIPLDNPAQMTETSNLALSAATKRPLDDEEIEEIKVSTPPTKKQKVVDQGKALESYVGDKSNPQTAVDVTPTTLNYSQPHSPIVILPISYDQYLKQWTSEKVNHRQGFSYRYAPESTLEQRLSMTDTLNRYIRGSVAQSNNDWRFGKYHGLSLWDNLDRTIIHGVWNLQNGNQPAGFERFYSCNGDYTDEIEKALMSDTEGEDDEPISPPKRVRVVESTQKQAPTDGSRLSLPKKQLIPDLQSKEGNRLRQDSSHLTGIEAGTARAGSGRGKKGKHADTPKINNYGSIGKPKSSQLRLTMKQRQMPQRLSYHGTISSARPRRNAARKNYAEDVDDDNGDGDFDLFESCESEGDI